MKLLIAYDGSDCSDSALDDLTRAGLPRQAEALVLTVAEIWLPQLENKSFKKQADLLDDDSALNDNRANGSKTHSEAKALAGHGRKRLSLHFPDWKIETVIGGGSAAAEILSCAEDFRADLIVVGSHGRGSVGRFLLGSVSNKIVSEAACSVRVARRGRVEVDPEPSRVVIAFDGSDGANRAIEAVTTRNWREASEFRLVTVADLVAPAAIKRFVPNAPFWVAEEIKAEREWIEKITAPALAKLRRANLMATAEIRDGNPKQILIEEAARWRADSIFVGANRAGSRLEKFLLGSVAAAVAARAHCSVEVVRKSR